jgi:hypothetical protein
MMQVIARWRVTVTFEGGRQQVIWISGSFVSNIMRMVADLSWTADGIEQPVNITIAREGAPNMNLSGGGSAGGIGSTIARGSGPVNPPAGVGAGGAGQISLGAHDDVGGIGR